MMPGDLVRIGDFCQTGSGITPSRSEMARYYEGGKTPWVKSGELRETVIHKTEENITDDALKETNIKLVQPGAILLAMYGATVGRLGILGVPATTNQAVCHIIPAPELADTRYVFHALLAQVSRITAKGVGGAQPNISQGVIKDLLVYLPSLVAQKRIAAILDKADALRAKRRKALEQLDALAQAIFIEMFGDPVTNPMRWGVASCDELCSRVTVGIVVQPASYYQPSGVPALRSLNIKSNKFDLSELVYFSAADNEALSKARVWAGDVVVVRSGRPGTAAVVSRELDGVNAIDILIASPKSDLLSGEYLSFFMNSNAGKRLVLGEERGQIQKHLNAGSLKKAEIPVPPIELQEKFVRRLKSLEESKVVLEKSALELDALFSSLQHRAFRGEL